MMANLNENNNPVALDSLYMETVRDHAKDPRNFGKLEAPALHAEGYNPLCGDRVEVYVERDQEKVGKVRFTGEGCSICMASASMMAEQVEMRPIAEVEKITEEFRDLLQDKRPAMSEESDLNALSGVKKFSVRIKCALLPWMTLKDALGKGKGDE